MRSLILITAFSLLSLGCASDGGVVGKLIGASNDTDSASSRTHCRKVADRYMRENWNDIDPLWREHTRYEQYRTCINKTG